METATPASPLTTLEERILKAVELVSQLRKENAALTEERDRALASAAAAEKELDTLRGEQKQVRQRVEKLLETIDSLGA
jgi:FtsZ-binding cell division protein ZapB